MTEQWMFDARLFPIGVPSVDGRILTGRPAVKLPLYLTTLLEGHRVYIGYAVEVRKNDANPWFTASGFLTNTAPLGELVDGRELALGIETQVDKTRIVTDDKGIRFSDPVIDSAVVYLDPATEPAFPGAQLRMLAPLSVL